MKSSLREHFDASPDPSPMTVPVGPYQLTLMDDNLHFGWSWHRYRYCYRRWENLRILDAGCGTGLTTLSLAQMNSGSKVLGLDDSPMSLEVADQRKAISETLDVTFRQYDLQERFPRTLGPYDFIVCRNVLHLTSRPREVLENLARVIDQRGLLYLTFPARPARHAARQVRRVLDILCPPGASLSDRATVAGDLFQALRPEHPLCRLESLVSGSDGPDMDRLIAGYLGPEGHDWDLEDALKLLEASGWKFLYEAIAQPWRPDLIFQTKIPASLRQRVSGLTDASRAVLIDALDQGMNLIEHRLYACLSSYEPRLPGWPEPNDPNEIDRLIPHRTDLVTRLPNQPDPSPGLSAQYRVVTGRVGPLDPYSDAQFLFVDGKRTCGEIEELIRTRYRINATKSELFERWLNLANHGFLALEPPDRRQYVDCVHLGPIRHRLDCPCPRKWVRACSRHEYCTIDSVDTNDPRHEAYVQALQELQIDGAISCAQCPDYSPIEQVSN